MSCITTTIRKNNDSEGGILVAEWDGDETAVAVYMGTDELLTLTPEETRVRDFILTSFSNVARKAEQPEVLEEEPTQNTVSKSKLYLTALAVFLSGIAIGLYL